MCIRDSYYVRAVAVAVLASPFSSVQCVFECVGENTSAVVAVKRVLGVGSFGLA